MLIRYGSCLRNKNKYVNTTRQGTCSLSKHTSASSKGFQSKTSPSLLEHWEEVPEELAEQIPLATGSVCTFTECSLWWVILLVRHSLPLKDSQTCHEHSMSGANRHSGSKSSSSQEIIIQLFALGNSLITTTSTLRECVLALRLVQAQLPTGPSKQPDPSLAAWLIYPTTPPEHLSTVPHPHSLPHVPATSTPMQNNQV